MLAKYRRAWFLLLALSVASGCKRLETGAREHFGKEFSCPEDRVVATKRDDLHWMSFQDPPATKAPPAEVAADPARLEKWKADQQDALEAEKRSFDDFVMYKVTGCAHEVYMGCHHPTDSDGAPVYDTVWCFIPTKGRTK